MTSTPSRSRASTRMSRPGMVGPSSARLAAGAAKGDFFFDPAVSVVLLMGSFGCGRRCGQQKTHSRVSRGFLLKCLHSTSANGVGNDYDDGQCDDLFGVFQHYALILAEFPVRSSPVFAGFTTFFAPLRL